MTNKTLPLTVILSSLLLAACTSQTPPQEQVNATPTTTQEQSMNASLRDIISKGGNLQCSFSATDDQAKSQTAGTIFASDNRFAEVATVTISGVAAAQQMNVISDGSYVYSWSSDAKTPGIKMKLESNQTTGQANEKANASLDKKMDMKCGNWTVDTSKFTVPTNITFTDVSSLMQPGSKTGNPSQIPTIPANMPTVPAGY